MLAGDYGLVHFLQYVTGLRRGKARITAPRAPGLSRFLEFCC
jgi:hypothetical protein